MDSEEDDSSDPNLPIDWNALSWSQKKRKICQDLKLDDNPILNADPVQKERLKERVTDHSDIWTDGLSYNASSLPSVPFISARMTFDPKTGPHTPHRAAAQVLNPIQRAGLNRKFEQWLSQQIIKETASKWSVPIISVLKKRHPNQDQPEYCFCANLCALNNNVLRDSLLTGSVPTNLALLESHEAYSALDLYNAFESCALEPSSRDFFSFSAPNGQQFRYQRLPQGFCNSPTIMARVTAELLARLPSSSREAKTRHAPPSAAESDPIGLSDPSGSQASPTSHKAGDSHPSGAQRVYPHPRIKPMDKTPTLENSGVLGYMDDSLLYSMTLADHINMLQIIFHRIKEAKCRLKTLKFFLGKPEVQYLGFLIGRNGRSMIP